MDSSIQVGPLLSLELAITDTQATDPTDIGPLAVGSSTSELLSFIDQTSQPSQLFLIGPSTFVPIRGLQPSLQPESDLDLSFFDASGLRVASDPADCLLN